MTEYEGLHGQLKAIAEHALSGYSVGKVKVHWHLSTIDWLDDQFEFDVSMNHPRIDAKVIQDLLRRVHSHLNLIGVPHGSVAAKFAAPDLLDGGSYETGIVYHVEDDEFTIYNERYLRRDARL